MRISVILPIARWRPFFEVHKHYAILPLSQILTNAYFLLSVTPPPLLLLIPFTFLIMLHSH